MKWIAFPQTVSFGHPNNIATKEKSLAGCKPIITLGIVGYTGICTKFYARRLKSMFLCKFGKKRAESSTKSSFLEVVSYFTLTILQIT